MSPYDKRRHATLQGLSDEEIFTLINSEEFWWYSIGHTPVCPKCAARIDAIKKRWRLGEVPILTAFQRELKRMENEIVAKDLDPPAIGLIHCVEHAFRMKSQSQKV
jgi:hypothetical protein